MTASLFHIVPPGAAAFALLLLLKAAVVLAAAWAAALLLRRSSAALRHALWSLALVLVLLLPLLALELPAWRVPVLPTVFGSIGEAKQAVPVSPLQPAVAAEFGAGSPAVAAGSGDAPPDALAGAAGEPVSVWTAFALLWSGVSVLVLLRLLGQSARISGIGSRAAPATGSAADLFTDLARDLGIRRQVRLRCSAEIAMPVTWGLRRPVVLLPREAACWPEERLRVVLLHELAHVRRLDYVWHLVSEIACAVYWPNPLVWLARRRMHAEQEQACDDRVLGTGAHAFEYAEHLLEVARAFHGSRLNLGGAVAMAREASLKGRLRAILDRSLNRRPVSPGAGLTLTLALLAIALPLAAVRPGAAGSVPAAPERFPGPRADGRAAAEPAHAEEDTLSGRVYVWLEAEEGALTAPMLLHADLDASGGRFIEVEDDHDSREKAPAAGRASYRVDLPKAGVYTVWGRVFTPNDEEDSFWVRVNGGPWILWNGMGAEGRWQWAPVRGAQRGAGVAQFDLPAGTHAIEIAYREDDARLDRLLVTDDVSFVPEGAGPAPTAQRPLYLWMEAEEAELADPMRGDRDERASGGSYVWVPAGSRNGEGAAAFRFTILEPGPYAVWGRASGPEDNENSFHFSMDEGRELVWDIPGRDPGRTAKRWTWDPVGARDDDTDPIIFNLKPGRHSILVRNRESGTKLDGLLVTNDLSYRPRGQGPLLPPVTPAYVSLEAESAHLPPSIQQGQDGEASNGVYVTVRSGRSSQQEPPTGGRLTYKFDVPQAGRYLLWGRVTAPDDASDSFWIRVNGGRWVRWNGIERSTSWRWNTVHDADYGEEIVLFTLPAGAQTLEVAYREDGIRLDKLLVTNDPAFRPDGTGAPPR